MNWPVVLSYKAVHALLALEVQIAATIAIGADALMMKVS